MHRLTLPGWAGVLACALGVLLGLPAPACAQVPVQRVLVQPHAADDRLPEAEPPHLIVQSEGAASAPLLVWLAGTGGHPATGPQRLYEAAVRQGYRVLALSYLSTPAVSQVCVGNRLRAMPDCAARFRQHRVWGEPISPLIADQSHDAIVPRLTALLQYLARTDAAGGWPGYLAGASPRWSRITLVGQSQGGGMAAYLAQTQPVAGVIVFSGGWDHDASGGIAAWYGRPSATPAQRWHATFHVDEPQAATMARIYQRLGLPEANIHALAEPVKGRAAHGEGISNPAYQDLWAQMLSTTMAR